jgi:hypothetical protein
MKLYRKQLNSVEELRRECIRLNYQKKHAGPLDLLGKNTSDNKKNKAVQESGSSSGIVSTALSLMSGGSTLQTVLSIAGPLLGKMGKSGGPKKIAGRIIRDVLIAYAAGKGLQILFRIVSRQMKKKKEQRLLEKSIVVPVRKR